VALSVPEKEHRGGGLPKLDLKGSFDLGTQITPYHFPAMASRKCEFGKKISVTGTLEGFIGEPRHLTTPTPVVEV